MLGHRAAWAIDEALRPLGVDVVAADDSAADMDLVLLPKIDLTALNLLKGVPALLRADLAHRRPAGWSLRRVELPRRRRAAVQRHGEGSHTFEHGQFRFLRLAVAL